MLLIKCRLKRLITLDYNEYSVLFTDQISINSPSENTWLSACFKTLGRAFETLNRAFQILRRDFEGLRENQKFDRVFKKLGCAFVLQHGPCYHNQPRYGTLNS